MENLRKLRRWCRDYRVAFKINSVINRFNVDQDMREHIKELNPVRWKVSRCRSGWAPRAKEERCPSQGAPRPQAKSGGCQRRGSPGPGVAGAGRERAKEARLRVFRITSRMLKTYLDAA